MVKEATPLTSVGIKEETNDVEDYLSDSVVFVSRIGGNEITLTWHRLTKDNHGGHINKGAKKWLAISLIILCRVAR